MSRPSVQIADPWIARYLFDALQTRCAEAEGCLKAVLTVIDPDLLERHLGDWKAATAEVTGATE